MNVIKEAFEGHPVLAAEKVWDTLTGALPAAAAYALEKVGSDEFQIALTATEAAAGDIVAGGFTTAAFVKGATDAFNIEVQQNKAVVLPDFFAALNLNVARLQAASTEAAA